MRVAILADCLADEPVYGVSVYAHNLVSALPGDGCDVTLAYVANPPRRSYQRVRIRRLWHSAIPGIPGRFRRSLFNSAVARFDVLHDPANYQLPPWKPPCKTVVTVHDVGALEMPEFFREATVHAFRTRLPAILPGVDAVITTTDMQKAKILRWFSIPGDRIHVVPFGIDRKIFRPKDGEAPVPQPYILSVSAPQERKGHIALLRAFDLLKDSVPHSLYLVGDANNWASEPVLEELRRLRLGGRVRLCGRIGNPGLARYYSFAEVMILPSLNEAFGIPALEAMMCGCPVILSRLDSLKQLYGDAAYYVEPGDVAAIAQGLKQVLGDGVLRRELAARGREFAAPFTAERMAQRTAEVYRAVLQA